MMAKAEVYRLGAVFIEALGLPTSTIWFELRMAVDESPKIKCEYYLPPANPTNMDELKTVLAEFELTPRESTKRPHD